ncbi:MAG: DNA recombination protein RmuC [Mariprofundus sp.]|nr:DNA recombination protein RmuC [Mariprofundus sp.]
MSIDSNLLIGLIVGLLAGFALHWFLSRGKRTTLEEQKRSFQKLEMEVEARGAQIESLKNDIQAHGIEKATLEERIRQLNQFQTDLESKLAHRDATIESLNQEVSRHQTTIAELRTAMEKDREAAVEKLALLEEAKTRLGNEFKLLANQIFEEKGKAFSEKNQSSLDEILKPVQSELKAFRDRIETVHKEDVEARGSLKEQLLNLQSLNKQMNDEARNLTRALKGDKKMQGDWGELILETVLEQSGLRKGKEYTTQGGFRDEGGNLRKPDVILNLPDGKHMIIDSKVSLLAYNEFMNAEDEPVRERALAAHVQSIRNHIDDLSSKDYSSLIGLKSPDFVFMFMPIEAAFMAAFQTDEKLFSKAFERNIVVVTPTTLLATLRTVENIWRYERQNENAKRIADKAGSVYDKLRGFLEDFEKIGSQLATVQKSYDGALNKLTHGQGNLVRQAQGFVELGVKVKKQLPKKILDEASLNDVAALEDQTENDN